MLKKWNLIEGDIKEASEKLKRKESDKINEYSRKLIDDSLTKLSTSQTKKQIIWDNCKEIIFPPKTPVLKNASPKTPPNSRTRKSLKIIEETNQFFIC